VRMVIQQMSKQRTVEETARYKNNQEKKRNNGKYPVDFKWVRSKGIIDRSVERERLLFCRDYEIVHVHIDEYA